MESIKSILMSRDGMTAEEAEERIEEARITLVLYLEEGQVLSAENICEDYFGLEPDYIMELM